VHHQVALPVNPAKYPHKHPVQPLACHHLTHHLKSRLSAPHSNLQLLLRFHLVEVPLVLQVRCPPWVLLRVLLLLLQVPHLQYQPLLPVRLHLTRHLKRRLSAPHSNLQLLLRIHLVEVLLVLQVSCPPWVLLRILPLFLQAPHLQRQPMFPARLLRTRHLKSRLSAPLSSLQIFHRSPPAKVPLMFRLRRPPQDLLRSQPLHHRVALPMDPARHPHKHPVLSPQTCQLQCQVQLQACLHLTRHL
jgi:hypothetical protein